MSTPFLYIRGRLENLYGVHWPPHGEAGTPSVRTVMDKTTGLFYDTEKNCVAVSQNANSIAFFTSNGFYAPKAIMEHVFMQSGNITTLRCEELEINIARIGFLLANVVDVNVEHVQNVISDVTTVDQMTCNVYLNENAVANSTYIVAGGFGNAYVDDTTVNAMNSNVSDTNTVYTQTAVISNEYSNVSTVSSGVVNELIVNETFSNVNRCNSAVVMSTAANVETVGIYEIEVSHTNSAAINTMICGKSVTDYANIDICDANDVHVIEDIAIFGNLTTNGQLVSIDSHVDISKYLEIYNLGGGTALDINQGGFSPIFVVYDKTTPVFKMYDGGIVNICRSGDSFNDGTNPISSHLVRIFGNASFVDVDIGTLDILTKFIASGTTTATTITTSTLTSTAQTTFSGATGIQNNLNTGTASISGGVSTGGDIFYNGTSTINRFSGLDTSFSSTSAALSTQIANDVAAISQQITSTYESLRAEFERAKADAESAIQSMKDSTAGLPAQRFAEGGTLGYQEGYDAGYPKGYDDQYKIGYDNVVAGQPVSYYQSIGFGRAMREYAGTYGVPTAIS
jgi:hypothetical protein